jgi:hypothetical protein
MNNKLVDFANSMQNELDANSHKGNWEDWKNIEEMIAELEWHKAKLLFALKENDKEKCKEYIADCANILFFIGNVGGLYD